MADQGGDDIVIHTMKDDLTGGGPKAPPPSLPAPNPVTSRASFTGPAPVNLPSPAPNTSIPVSKLPTLQPTKPLTPSFSPTTPLEPSRPKVTAPPSTPPAWRSPSADLAKLGSSSSEVGTQFPLPPRREQAAIPTSTAASVSNLPHVARRNRRRLLMWGGLITAFILIAGGGAWAFITFVSAPAPVQETPAVATSEATEVIPASASVALHYRLETPANRSQLLELWQNSPKTLLQGNPKTLLNDAQVQQFMYVTLSGESRPYLLIPKEGVNEQQLSQFSESQVTEVGGWYVVHALNASPFAQALMQGKGMSDAASARFKDGADTNPLKIYLAESALNQIRSGSAGEAFGAGSVKAALISARATISGRALVFDGLGELSLTTPATAAAAGQVDQSFLAAIPGDATFVRLSASLTADITAWQNIARVLSKSVLDQSAVASLIRQLTTPYAYYHRTGGDGAPDLGLTFKVPEEITPPLVLGDTALEQAFSAILPLILAEKPAVSLAFADGVYQQAPLRFVNISGSIKALDYSLEEKTVRFASSKEGMFAVLDVAGKRAPSLENSEPWNTLLEEWGVLPLTREFLLGYLSFAPLLDLLPTQEAKLPAATTQETTPEGFRLSGVLVLNPQPQGTPSLTPTPTPTP